MNLSWHCIGHNPTEWGLGEYYQDENILRNIKARIQRLRSGKWSILIFGNTHLDYLPINFIEPSRIEAMKEVEKIIDITRTSYKALA